MYIEVTESIFIDVFRSIRPNQFSYAGLQALYEFLTDRADYEEMELDVIAICCDFCQYDTEEEALEAYDVKSMYELVQETVVLECADDTFIVCIS
jgi:hypothetical protein